MTTFRKTDRKYGAMTQAVLSRKDRFTWKDLLPELTRTQARMRCQQLLREGLLRLVRAADIGRNAKPAIYEVPAT